MQAPACAADGGSSLSTFDVALAAADANAGRDRLVVGPITTTGGPWMVSDIDLEGSGSSTVFTGAPDNQTLLSLVDSTAKDFRIAITAGENVAGLGLTQSKASGVEVDLSKAFWDSGPRPTALTMTSGSLAEQASEFVGGRVLTSVGHGVHAIGLAAPTRLSRSEVIVNAVPAAAVLAANHVLVERSTLIGTGTGPVGAVAPANSSLTVTSSALVGFTTDATRLSPPQVICFPTPPCISLPGPPANLTIRNSLVDPGKVQESGPGALTLEDNVTGAPGFRSATDLRPRFDSILVDAGAASSTGPDKAGLPVVDGDGNGSAIPDIGAHEYQRRAPLVTVGAPASAASGAPVALTATATDPEGETLGGVVWSFDDGTTATGPAVTKAFAAGLRTVTASVTDAAGATGTTAVKIAVAPPPLPPVPPVPPPPVAAASGGDAAKSPAKLRVRRAGVKDGRLDVLAEITKRAGGKLEVEYESGGRKHRFEVAIPSNGIVKIDERLPKQMRRSRTGIIEIDYAGDGSVRPDDVRLRAASRKANLERRTTTLKDGRLRVDGTISTRARGVVRIRLGYLDTDGTLKFLRLRAKIDDGKWKLDERLTGAAANGGQLSIQFTGYRPANMRGEQTAKQVLPSS